MRVPPEAERQAGAFTRTQARRAGIARATITRRVAAGTWKPVLAGVLVERGTPLTTMTRAWAGRLSTGGVVSHETAAALHGIAPEGSSIHVISRRNLHVAVPGVTEHRVQLDGAETMRHRGLLITSRERTVIDLLAGAQASNAMTLLFRAVQQGWIDGPRLASAIDRRRGRHGTAQLRRLAAMLGTNAHSVAERLLHQILADIPDLEWFANRPLRTSAGRIVPDVAVPTHKLVIEVDGERFHTGTEQFVRDRRRQNTLVIEGWTVLRFTWLDVVDRPEQVRRTIAESLAVSSVTKVMRTGP